LFGSSLGLKQGRFGTSVAKGVNPNDLVTKGELDSKIGNSSPSYVKKSGDTMTGDLIFQPQIYPIHGDLNKAISYGDMR